MPVGGVRVVVDDTRRGGGPGDVGAAAACCRSPRHPPGSTGGSPARRRCPPTAADARTPRGHSGPARQPRALASRPPARAGRCRGGLSPTNRTRNVTGHSLPVTRNVPSPPGTAAMPLSTSVPARRPGSSSPAASTTAVTRPVAGSMRTMRSVCQTFAHTCPPTHSSSLSRSTGAPSSVTATEPGSANVSRDRGSAGGPCRRCGPAGCRRSTAPSPRRSIGTCRRSVSVALSHSSTTPSLPGQLPDPVADHRDALAEQLPRAAATDRRTAPVSGSSSRSCERPSSPVPS